MTEATTTISVRGEARQVVPPDYAVLTTSIRVRNPDKEVALERAGAAQSAALDVLRERSGQALTVDTVDAALTWSTTSYSAQQVRVFDRQKQERRRAWRVAVPLTVTVRNLRQVDEIGEALAGIAPLHVNRIQWGVDPRNPAWPTVRAAAITDAIAKARDYAAALGGSVTALVHVADAGLLGGEPYARHRFHDNSASLAAEASGVGGPSLDPAPQEISAVVEARFAATVAAL